MHPREHSLLGALLREASQFPFSHLTCRPRHLILKAFSRTSHVKTTLPNGPCRNDTKYCELLLLCLSPVLEDEQPRGFAKGALRMVSPRIGPKMKWKSTETEKREKNMEKKEKKKNGKNGRKRGKTETEKMVRNGTNGRKRENKRKKTETKQGKRRKMGKNGNGKNGKKRNKQKRTGKKRMKMGKKRKKTETEQGKKEENGRKRKTKGSDTVPATSILRNPDNLAKPKKIASRG